MSTTQKIICSDEDGEFYALRGDLTRDEATAELRSIDVRIEGVDQEDEFGYPLVLERSHLRPMTDEERVVEFGDEYDEAFCECSDVDPGAFEAWVARVA